MTVVDFSERSVEMLADEYARSRKDRFKPVSVKAAISALRMFQPNNALTDQEMTSIIAAKAVEYGHIIDFDAK